MKEPADDTPAEEVEEQESGPARELTAHLLRMLETRADAVGIAVQTEIDAFSKRLKLQVIAGVAIFLAVWAGIVLIAVVVPPHLRVPVLSAVVGVLVVGAVIAFMIANRKTDSHEVGTMAWFLDGLRRDIDVFTRALEKTRTPTPAPSPPPATDSRNPDDLAA